MALLISIFPVNVKKELSHYDDGSFSLNHIFGRLHGATIRAAV
jgi:hypothetical protein